MISSLATILLYALPGVAMLIAGGAAAAFWKTGPVLRSMLQHFAAGMVFAVVAVEMLPQVRQDASPLWISVGFTLGVIAMLGLRWLGGEDAAGENAKDGNAGRSSVGLLGAMTVDVFVDGLLLGAGFAVGGKEGLLLASALAGELLCLGLTTSATLVQMSGRPRWKAIATTAAIAIPFLIGSLLGASLLQGVSGNVLGAVLSFGCAALLYLVTEELLVEAHEAPHTAVAAAMFFAGFQFFLILGMFE
ncbi:MAG TPA: transporter [Pirellulales bacterium]|nr:transporter [Pirellulales bacterium]